MRVGVAAGASTDTRSERPPRYASVVKIRELLTQLRQDGWYEVRRRGSHRVMRHAGKRGIVVVAGNPNADMKAGTLGQVLKQAGLKDGDGEPR